MGLADKLKEVSVIDKATFCAYKVMYDSLSDNDKAALDDAWARGVSTLTILSILRSENIKSSNESIRQHRTGACKCPKPKK
jgi:hypothetical protein